MSIKSNSGWLCYILEKITRLCKRRNNSILFEDEAAVERKANLDQRILIMYQDNVYDVTKYLDKHPGGSQILQFANSKIVDKVFDKYHYPKGSARKTMMKYYIGRICRRPIDGLGELVTIHHDNCNLSGGQVHVAIQEDISFRSTNNEKLIKVAE